MNHMGELFENDRDDTQECSRFLNGKFLITKKTSIINKLKGDLDAYEGIHNNMSREEYKNLMIDVRNRVFAKS